MENNFDEIVSILEKYPLCSKIVTFFLERNFAMDTAKGIADWWLEKDLEATQEALNQLVSCGVVILRTYSGINLYSFTNNPRLRAKLKEYYNNLKGEAILDGLKIMKQEAD